MRTQNQIGASNQELDTRRGNATLINSYIEKSGPFQRIRRTEGLTPFLSVGKGPARGMLVARGVLFVATGREIYKVEDIGGELVTELIGVTNNQATPVSIATNGADVGEVIFVNNGDSWIYDGTDFEKLTFSDNGINPDNTVAVLNQRFYVNSPDSNIFQASAVAEGKVWPGLDLAAADASPDSIRAITAIRNNLLIIGDRSTEYWQAQIVPEGIPVRRVIGATGNRGISAIYSIAKYEDKVFWLADDLTVVVQQGNNRQKISDLAVEQAIQGSANVPAYSDPNSAEGFFIDDTIHKLYVLTFPKDDVTWCFDTSTGLWHRRKSLGLGRWRAKQSANAFGEILLGDYDSGQLWRFDRNSYKEGSDRQEFIIETAPVYGSKGGIFVSEMEMVMDVGIGDSNNREKNLIQDDSMGGTEPVDRNLPLAPEMQVEVSRDGGFSWVKRNNINLGRIGERSKKVIQRSLGYTPRHGEFMLRLTVTDDVPLNIYSLFYDIDEGE